MNHQLENERNVEAICEDWIKAGLGEDCFWEWWPECPTPDDCITPKDLLVYIEKLRASIAQAVAALEVYAEPCDGNEDIPCGYSGNLCCKVAKDTVYKLKQI